MDQATTDKLCKRCGETKSVSLFSKNKNTKDGLQFYCRPCASAQTMSSRDSGNYRRYQDANRHHSQLTSIRARAKKGGIPFDLTIEDLEDIPEICPVLGIPLLRNLGNGFPSENSPSVDRIIPALGYVKDNIIIVSTLANRIKQNATPQQIKKVADFYEKLLSESPCPTDPAENLQPST